MIRRAFHSEAGNSTTERGVDLRLAVEDGRFIDLGDVEIENRPGPQGVEAIEGAIGEILSEGRRAFALGGDHAVTYPILRAYGRSYPRLTILHFDAHCDLYPEFEGDPLSHACPFARVMEQGPATRLIQIGIRTLNAVQQRQVDRFGVEVIDMSRLRSFKPADLDLKGPVYLSFDLDALDPAFAPGLSHREPGGLSSRQAIDLLHDLLAGPELEFVGADLVEYNPTQDLGGSGGPNGEPGSTATVAGKLMKEIAGLMLS